MCKRWPLGPSCGFLVVTIALHVISRFDSKVYIDEDHEDIHHILLFVAFCSELACLIVSLVILCEGDDVKTIGEVISIVLALLPAIIYIVDLIVSPRSHKFTDLKALTWSEIIIYAEFGLDILSFTLLSIRLGTKIGRCSDDVPYKRFQNS